MERAIDDNRIFHNRAGFWRHNNDEKEYLLLPNVFRDEICSGLDHKNVIRVLSNQKWFVTDNMVSMQQNIRLPGLGQKRCYVFSSKRMGLSALSCRLKVPDLVVSSGTYGNTYVHKRFSVTTIQKMVGTSGIKYLLLLHCYHKKSYGNR